MKLIPSVVEDNPTVITAVLVAVVAGWRICVWRRLVPSYIETFLSKTDPTISVPIALGLASVAAIAAGFAGAIIVFGISSDSVIMQAFRKKTGNALRANWKSVIASSFASAVLGLFGATLIAAHWIWLAAPTLLLGVLLLLHSLTRMVWLFGVLLNLVATQDHQIDRKARKRTTSEIFSGAA
jgi:hypothetical protein